MNFIPVKVSTLYRCPRIAKKLHDLFVIKDINFFFFLDDSHASTVLFVDSSLWNDHIV
jgi:hypothetical protein